MDNIKESSLVSLIRKRKIKEKQRPKEISKELKEENLIHWTTFYRRNINIYIERRLGVHLYPFQHIMIYLMSVSKTFFAICSRGLAKTFDVAIYSVAICMLKPYSEVVITAKTIEQASRMVEDKMLGELFVGKMSPNFPLLQYLYENDYIKVQKNDKGNGYIVKFTFNGSWIKVLPANENSRGSRATLLIYEECRLIPKSIIDGVFAKMAHPRQATYMNLPEYQDENGKPLDRWLEGCQSVFITSAKYTTEWFWKYFKSTAKTSLKTMGEKENIFAGDIFLAMKFGLKTKDDYFSAKKKSEEFDFLIEDLNQMLGEAEGAFFTRAMFKKNQINKKPFYPLSTDDFQIGNIDEEMRKAKQKEYRLLFVDFAFASSTSKSENDNTVIGCLSMKYEDDGKIHRRCDYLVKLNGGDSELTEKTIRELYFDYEADYIVMDILNGGEMYYRNLGKEYKHPERISREENNYNQEETKCDNTTLYWNPHGFTVTDEKHLHVLQDAKILEMRKITVDQQPIPCIIPMQGSEILNSLMWLDLQMKLRDKLITFLIDDVEYYEMMETSNEYLYMDSEEKARQSMPYKNTMSLILEAVNLDKKWNNGKVKLSEPRSGTKDMIVSLSYGNYIATLLENYLNKDGQQDDFNEEDFYGIYGIEKSRNTITRSMKQTSIDDDWEDAFL